MYIVGIDIAKCFHEAAIIDSSGKNSRRILCSPTPCAFIRQTENDAIDVLIVAEVIRFGRYCETQVAPETSLTLLPTSNAKLSHCSTKLLLKTLLSAFFSKRNALRAKTIWPLSGMFVTRCVPLFLPSFMIINLMFRLQLTLDFS